MSAAMINVGLMRESRFPIQNATAHAYACVTVVATGLPSGKTPTGLRPPVRRRLVGHLKPEVNFVATLTLEKS